MKRRILGLVLLLVCLTAAGGTAALAADVYVSGLVPNWDQPYNYGDAFDPSGPGAMPVNPPQPWEAWCTPTAAAMMMGHWADVKGVATTGDAFKDGNQGIANGYKGTKWPLGADWHDYTADGTAARPNAGPYSPARQTDIGWYMNTNDLGASNLLTNGGVPHTGTYVGNCAEGLNDFLTARGSPLAGKATTTYVNGTTVLVPTLVATIKSEIDANRTVLGHFKWWVNANSGPVPSSPNGNGTETSELQFETATPPSFGLYTFPSSNPGSGPNGEVWNGTSGVEGLGHTVCIVGYTPDGQGGVADLICHDNWPTTVRDVQIAVIQAGPVFFPLDAITTLTPEPGTWALLMTAALAMAGWAAVRRRR